MSFDTVTLYGVVTAAAALGAILLGTLGRRALGLPGALTWAGGLGVLSVYFLLALLHQRLPAWAGLALANGLGVAAMGLMHRGANQICGRPFRPGFHVAATVVVTLVILTLLDDAAADYAARVFLVGVVTATQCVMVAATLAPAGPDVAPEERRGRYVAMGLFGSVAVLQLARVLAHTPLVGANETGLLSAAALSQVSAVAFLAWCLAIPVVVVYIHEVRARHLLQTAVGDLRKALAEVKTLRELLPICASCRRIRDDRDEWSSLEEYLETHAGVQLTHGVCPECITRLYPELESMRR